MQDLYLKPKSKKEQLYDFIKSKGRVFTHEITQWGLDHYYIEAPKRARELAQAGRIWRVRDYVTKVIAPKSREEIWSVYENDKIL